MRYPTLSRSGFVLPSNLKASYESAGTGRRTDSWTAPDSGPNAINQNNLRTIRNRSRAAVRNDPYAGHAIDRRVSNTIGTGITPRSEHPDRAVREQLQALWQDWTEESDADEVLDFYGQQALAARSVETAGEVFVRLRPRPLSDGLAVPLQLQLLAPDYVPIEKNDRLPNGNTIRAGIEFAPGGKRVAYWMYPSHPGERASLGGDTRLMRVPADQVLHLFDPREPGQIRGVPRLAPILLRLRTLDNYDDAVLFRQEVSNLFAGFIKRPAGSAALDPTNGQPYRNDLDGVPMVALEPGTMQELADGEEVVFSDPPDAGNNYPDFMRQQLQAAAAGAGLPYELFTGDMRDVSDRVLRVILNEFRRRIEQLQYNVFVHQLCRPTRAAWLDTAVLAGAISLPDYTKRRRQYLRTRWVPQGWAYMHPVQDVQAKRMEVRSGFTSRSEVALRQGNDAEQIDRENAADRQRERELGLSYDSTTIDDTLDKDDK